MDNDEIWRQLQMQNDDKESQGNSSVMGGLSDANYGDKLVQAGILSTGERDSESTYSNFKTAHANMFTMSSSNANIQNHNPSLSPKVSRIAKARSGLTNILPGTTTVHEEGKRKEATSNQGDFHTAMDR